jgi:Fic family protein
LLADGRGSERRPGEFRTSQNWIGGARPGIAKFLPPPPELLQQCLADLERFLHDRPNRTPTLLKAALAHVQFETIHPFLDGNGRLGRLLITLLLVAEGVLREPLLYLSLYFKMNRDTYYELLQRVRTHGEWEEWVSFFMEGVRETAEQAVVTAKRLAALFLEDRERVAKLGRIAGSALLVHHLLQRRPVQTVRSAQEGTGSTAPTVAAMLKALEKEGIVREVTGKQRNRIFVYERYVQILNEGTTSPADRR